MQNSDFGKRFTELIKEKKISNNYITEKAEISKNNVGNYKNGQIPNATILYKLSQILGVSMEYLLTGKETENLTPAEQELVDTFRSCSSIGQSLIQEHASTIRQKLPAETTEQSGVSTSMIG
jgi:transcriptional regulator with XRE-family HTH domain